MSFHLASRVLLVGSFLTMCGPAKAEGWVTTELNARGGCGVVTTARIDSDNSKIEWVLSGRGGTPSFLGRPINRVTDDDVTEAFDYYHRCFMKRDGFSSSVPMSDPRRAAAAPQHRDFVNRLLAAPERRLRQFVAQFQDQRQQEEQRRVAQQAAEKQRALDEERAQEAQQRRLAQETDDRRRQNAADEAHRRAQSEKFAVEAKEQAQRDREAAAELSRQAEAEEKSLAETKRVADEARRAREAAEQRLALIRRERETSENQLAKDRAATAPLRERHNGGEDTDPKTLTVNDFHNAFNRVALGEGVTVRARLTRCSAAKQAVCTYTFGDDVGALAAADLPEGRVTSVSVMNSLKSDQAVQSALQIYDLTIQVVAPNMDADQRSAAVAYLVRALKDKREANITAGTIKLQLSRFTSLGMLMFVANIGDS